MPRCVSVRSLILLPILRRFAPLLLLLCLQSAFATDLLIYDNTQSDSTFYFANGGAATQSGNTITTLVADDITPLAGYGGQPITTLYYAVVNANGTPVSARVHLRFWYANGPSGGPGTFIQGFTAGPLSLPAGTSRHTLSPGGAMTVPTNTFWFGITFDNNTNTTGITAAQLNNLGLEIYGPPATGSSADRAFQTASAGSFAASNPSGSTFTFGGSPAADFYFGLGVAGGNHPPVAFAQSLNLQENHSLPVTLTASDPDNNPLTYAIVNGPTNGTLTGVLPNLTYTPHANFYGADAFTFKANDGQVDSAPALISISVTRNQRPVANSQSLNVLKNTGVAITLTATDADADPLTYRIVNSPTNGTLTGTAPNVTYTPNSGFAGPDAFTFVANDGQTDSVPAMVSLSVLNSAGLIIHAIYDTSITSSPNAATITNTINAAILAYETRFSDPVTVSILFANMNSGLGQSSSYVNTISYSSYWNALSAHAVTTNDTLALAHLPGGANNPVDGGTSITLTTPNLRALGFSATPPTNHDGIIWLNLALCNLDRTTIDPNKFDLMAVASHEMDEVLGTGSGLGDAHIQPPDLFRYSSTAGVRNYTTSGDDAYFSLDGTQDLARYNQDPSGDYGDWWSTGPHTPQVQDAFATAGATPDLGVEYTVLDAIGWTLVSTQPAPQFTGITHTDNTVTLSWSAVSGRSYQLQYTTQLNPPAWSNLGSPITANSTVASYTDSTSSSPDKFYRVALLTGSGAAPAVAPHVESPLSPPTLSTHYFRPGTAVALGQTQ